MQNKSIAQNQQEIYDKLLQVQQELEERFGAGEGDVFDAPLLSFLGIEISIRQGLQLMLASTLGLAVGSSIGAIGSLLDGTVSNKDLSDKLDDIGLSSGRHTVRR